MGCSTEVSEKVKLQMKDMPNLRVCLDAAEADPSQLDRVAAAPAAATILTGEGAEAAAATQDANHGLVNFHLFPRYAPPVSNLKNQHMFCCLLTPPGLISLQRTERIQTASFCSAKTKRVRRWRSRLR